MSKRKQPSILSSFAKIPRTSAGSTRNQLPDIEETLVCNQFLEQPVNKQLESTSDISQYINLTTLSDEQRHQILTNKFFHPQDGKALLGILEPKREEFLLLCLIK